MPYATNDGTRLFYETQGAGEPLLLIMGLGMNATGWYRQLPDLAAHYEVIVFDNRGVGRSDIPEGPYTTEAMAADAAAVLDAVGVETAHVLGASMGGFIAQELALHFPARLRSLILACTASGGPHAVPAESWILEILAKRGFISAEEAVRASIPFVYAAETIRDRPALIEEDVAYRLRYPPTAPGYFSQLQACMSHDTWERLPEIRVPTLVMHGGADQLVPTANAELLAGRIASAKLLIVPGTGHMFFSEAAAAVNEAILDFLRRHS